MNGFLIAKGRDIITYLDQKTTELWELGYQPKYAILDDISYKAVNAHISHLASRPDCLADTILTSCGKLEIIYLQHIDAIDVLCSGSDEFKRRSKL